MAYHLTGTNPKNKEDIQVALVDYWMEHQEARIERLRRANAGLTHPAARFFHAKISIGQQKAPASLLRRLENQHTCVHFYTAQSESHEKYCLSLPALHRVKGYRVRAVVWHISYSDQECERDDLYDDPLPPGMARQLHPTDSQQHLDKLLVGRFEPREKSVRFQMVSKKAVDAERPRVETVQTPPAAPWVNSGPAQPLLWATVPGVGGVRVANRARNLVTGTGFGCNVLVVGMKRRLVLWVMIVMAHALAIVRLSCRNLGTYDREIP